jgi:hypothetical protein
MFSREGQKGKERGKLRGWKNRRFGKVIKENGWKELNIIKGFMKGREK